MEYNDLFFYRICTRAERGARVEVVFEEFRGVKVLGTIDVTACVFVRVASINHKVINWEFSLNHVNHGLSGDVFEVRVSPTSGHRKSQPP